MFGVVLAKVRRSPVGYVIVNESQTESLMRKLLQESLCAQSGYMRDGR